MIDISKLTKAMEAGAQAQAAGTPLDIDVALIDEDAEQPRKEFDETALAELAASITLKGVKSPVSVRPHPSEGGRWILNYGARRLRASVMAGKPTIPAFVDESHDSYDQVIENLQRDDLKPIELALFVQKQINAGNRKKDIAKSLGKSQNFITDLLALIDMPPSIEGLFRIGRLSSPRTVLELRRLYDKHQELVEEAISEWVMSGADIGHGLVAALAERLSSAYVPEPSSEPQEPAPVDEEVSEGDTDTLSGRGFETHEAGEEDTDEIVPYHNPGVEAKGKEPQTSNSDRIKKPLVLVYFKRREATLLLNKRPSTDGLAWIKYEDGSEEEVAANSIKINLITESI